MTTPDSPIAPEPELYRATARRAPRFGRFLTLGGLVGAIVAFVLIATHRTTDGTSVANDDLGIWVIVVFFFAIGGGLVVGAVVAVALDRASRRRAAVVTVERGEVGEEAEPVQDA